MKILDLTNWTLENIKLAKRDQDTVHYYRDTQFKKFKQSAQDAENNIDVLFLPGGRLRDLNRYKPKVVVATSHMPPIQDLLNYRFMKYVYWPSLHGIPIADPYVLYIGTSIDLPPIPPDFLPENKEPCGLTSIEDEYYYFMRGNLWEKLIYSSRYPMPRPFLKMFDRAPSRYKGNAADALEPGTYILSDGYQGEAAPKGKKLVTRLPMQTLYDIYGITPPPRVSIRTIVQWLYRTFPVKMIRELLAGIEKHITSVQPCPAPTPTLLHPVYLRLVECYDAAFDYDTARHTFTNEDIVCYSLYGSVQKRLGLPTLVTPPVGWTITVEAVTGKLTLYDDSMTKVQTIA